MYYLLGEIYTLVADTRKGKIINPLIESIMKTSCALDLTTDQTEMLTNDIADMILMAMMDSRVRDEALQICEEQRQKENESQRNKCDGDKDRLRTTSDDASSSITGST